MLRLPSLSRGDTLLEVLAALFVMAFAALGMAALQSWVSRSEQAARWLDAAVDAASTAAEIMRAGIGSSAAATLVQQSAAVLPDGRIAVTPLDAGLARIDVSWTEPPRWGASASVASCTLAGGSSHPGWQPHCLSFWVAP